MRCAVTLMVVPVAIVALLLILCAPGTGIVAIDDAEANAVTGRQTSGCVTTKNALSACGLAMCPGSGTMTDCNDIAVYLSNGAGNWQIIQGQATCYTCSSQATCTTVNVPDIKVACQ